MNKAKQEAEILDQFVQKTKQQIITSEARFDSLNGKLKIEFSEDIFLPAYLVNFDSN